MSLSTLRRLRHGPLKRFGPAWTVLGRIYRFVFRALGLHRSVETRIGPYGPFRLNGLFAFSDFENWGGAHNDAFKLCVEACRDKNCVIDVGAHIGLVALPAASVVARQGRVICFEPARANRELLVEHARRNGFANIEVVPWLVGEKQLTAVPFFAMNEPTGMNSIVAPRNARTYRETFCQQVSLDFYCKTYDIRPQVIKIDVEGAEVGVLRGARATISKFRPTIFLSVHPREIVSLGGTIESLVALIDELDYSLRDVQGRKPERLELREYVLTPGKA